MASKIMCPLFLQYSKKEIDWFDGIVPELAPVDRMMKLHETYFKVENGKVVISIKNMSSMEIKFLHQMLVVLLI